MCEPKDNQGTLVRGMQKKPSPFPSVLIVLWLGFVALACSLSSSEAPPTLVPRASDTPMPTIGYATLSPPQLPQQPAAPTALPVQPQQPAPTQPPPLPAAAPLLAGLLDQVAVDRLFMHVDTLQRFQTRHINSADQPDQGIGAAYRYIHAYFDDLSKTSGGTFSVFDHPFEMEWGGRKTTQINVVGVVQGKDIGGGVVLVGAHYDSISIASQDPQYFSPGANDNGSGVAALLEIARLLSQRPHRATIMLVAFSAEEVGRRGSIAFAKYLQERQISVNAMLNLDIIGSMTGPNGQINDRQIRVFSAGPNTSPSRQLARTLELVSLRYLPAMQVVVQDGLDRTGRYGDHQSFSDVGIPAVRLIEMMEDPSRHHTPRDNIESIDATYLLRSTQTALAAVTALADGPPPPLGVTLQPNAAGTKTLAWQASPGAAGYIVALRRPNSLIYDQQFPWNTTSVDWDGFRRDQFEALAVLAVDASGLMGPPSPEVIIP